MKSQTINYPKYIFSTITGHFGDSSQCLQWDLVSGNFIPSKQQVIWESIFHYISEQPCLDLYRLFWFIIEMIEDYCIITFVINPLINPDSFENLSIDVFLFNFCWKWVNIQTTPHIVNLFLGETTYILRHKSLWGKFSCKWHLKYFFL